MGMQWWGWQREKAKRDGVVGDKHRFCHLKPHMIPLLLPMALSPFRCHFRFLYNSLFCSHLFSLLGCVDPKILQWVNSTNLPDFGRLCSTEEWLWFDFESWLSANLLNVITTEKKGLAGFMRLDLNWVLVQY